MVRTKPVKKLVSKNLNNRKVVAVKYESPNF